MTSATVHLSSNWAACQRRSLAVGILALAGLTGGGLFDPSQFFRAYLAAYLFYLGMGLGSLAILMIYHVTGGAWGFLIRRILEAAVRTMPLLAIGFIPVAVGAPYLYPFAQPEMASNELIQQQQLYMNLPFFWTRAAVFFLLWLACGYLLNAWSRAQDRTGDPRWARRCENLSGPGLVIYGISIHFASIDWIMSLQPAFHSTIMGPLVASGHLLSALALAIIVLACLCERAPFADIVSPKALNDLGNLLLSFVVIWTYMNWFQYMLVWMANLPVDVIWYVPRLRGGWLWLALALVVLHFAVPFVLLLWRAVKQNPRSVARVAALLLVMQLAFMDLQIAPVFPADELLEHWMDLVAPLALGGVWLACFIWQLGRWPLLAEHDFNQASAARLRRADEHEAKLEEALSHG